MIAEVILVISALTYKSTKKYKVQSALKRDVQVL